MNRRAGWILSCVAFAIAGGGALAHAIEPEIERADALEAAIETLEAKVGWSERYPLLRPIAYGLLVDVAPHRNAIERLAGVDDVRATRALLRAFANTAHPHRIAIVDALTRAPHPDAVPALAPRVADADEALARAAAHALGLIANELEEDESVERARLALANALRSDPRPAVRAAALRGLATIDRPQAHRAAFELGAADPHPRVRCEWIAATPLFASATPPAAVRRAQLVTSLRAQLDRSTADPPLGVFARGRHASRSLAQVGPELERRSDCLDVDEAAMRWLATLGDPAAKPALARAADSSDPLRRATAAFGHARFADDKSFERLVGALEHAAFGERKAAIEGLGDSRHPGADAVLIELLARGSRLDRREAARALAGSFGASLALIGAFDDPAVEVRDAAEAALLRSDVVVAKIEERLEAIAAEALAAPDAAGTEVRKQRLEEGLVRWRAERRAAAAALIRALANDDPRIRVRAARVLSRYRDAQTRAELETSLVSAPAPAGASAALALGLRGEREACPALERVLERELKRESERESERADSERAIAAARALGDIGCAGSLARLRSALRVAQEAQHERLASAIGYAVRRLERHARASTLR